jgi:ankyrin repeat protein
MKTMTGLVLGLLLCTGGVASAQPPAAARLTKAEVLKADLFIAISKQRPAEVKRLLARGADPNGRNWLSLTPLMWAASRGNQEIVDMLLKRGAKINDTSMLGSLLTLAEMGRHEKMALYLLARGAAVNTPRLDKATPLMFAAANGHTVLIERLLQKHADPNHKDTDGATALIWAARVGQTKAVERLLRAGADVNAADSHGRTALMYAAMNGHPQSVERLLKSGAKVEAKDKQEATALLLAARYSGHPSILRALLQKGAQTTAQDSAGQTALALVRTRGYQEAEGALREFMTVPAELPAPPPVSVKRAVEKSLTVVQVGMKTYNKRMGCTSCHHQGLGLMAVGYAAQRGYAVDKELIGSYLQQMEKEAKGSASLVHQALSNPDAAKLVIPTDIGDMPITSGYVLGGMLANRVPQNPGLAEMALLLAGHQEADGHWGFTMEREPMQSSHLTTTALTLQALRAYTPKEKEASLAVRYLRARRWLLTVPTPNVEDKASRLLGLKWVGATTEERARAVQELRAAQRPDGGWAQLPSLASDAYATGLTLYALRVGGELASNDPAVQRGVQYLLRMQDEDGSWYVNKRTLPANVYFDGGFPHGQSQYSSFAGSCWATLALLETTEPTQIARQ